MREKRHRFTHPDPEKEKSSPSPDKERARHKKRSPAQRDLKSSFIFITIFLALLAVLYFADNRLNLIDYFKGLL